MTEKTDIRDSDEKVVEIEMERLRNFTNHPFKIIGDSQMIELQDSIKKYGVLNPLMSGRGKKVTMKSFQVTEGNMQRSDWGIIKFL